MKCCLKSEVGSGHEHGIAMCSRFAVQEVGGSGAHDFCFLGCLRKAFHRLIGTIQLTVNTAHRTSTQASFTHQGWA